MLSDLEARVAESRWTSWRQKLTEQGAVPILAIAVQPGPALSLARLVFACPPEVSGDLVQILRSVADSLEAKAPTARPRLIETP